MTFLHVKLIKNLQGLRLVFLILFAAGLTPLTAAPIQAEKALSESVFYPGESPPPSEKKDWRIRLGGFGLYHPEYEGSDDYEILGFPFIDASWKYLFFNPRTGLGFRLPQEGPLKVGLALGYVFGREEDDADDLEGLGDVDDGLAVSALLEWKIIKKISFKVRVEHQVSGEDTGTQCHFSLGYKTFLPPKFILMPSLKATWSSTQYMQAYFGVDADQSIRSDYPEYDPDAGFKSVGLQLLMIYPFAEKWGLQVLGGYERLVGDAADSPVVRDADQFNAGLGLSRSF